MTDELDAKYSAAGLGSCTAPPGAGRPQRVRDVLLVAIGDVVGDADLGGEFGAHPHPPAFTTSNRVRASSQVRRT
jgi:hypothetical protein